MHQWAAGLGWPLEACLRLLIATLLGGLVGLEREIRGRQAGFRTNILVCLGSALVMIVSTSFARLEWPHAAGSNVNIDPARVAYGVMTGIGFLGAGVIIKHNGAVRGLTTAAGLWCVAAIGLGTGLGLYVIGVVAALLVVVALWTLDYLESALPRVRYRTITVRRPWSDGIVDQTIEFLRKRPMLHIVGYTFERVGDLKQVDIHLRIAFIKRSKYMRFEREFVAMPDCEIVSLGYD